MCVSLEHGVDCLAEFGRVGLVDTACVGPDESIPEHVCRLAETHKLGKTCTLDGALLAEGGRKSCGRDILIAQLTVCPAV